MVAVYPSSVGDATQGDAARPRKLLDQLQDVLRAKHNSYRTEQAYVDWARRFILFHGKRHLREMGAAEIERFLTHLAVEMAFGIRASAFGVSKRSPNPPRRSPFTTSQAPLLDELACVLRLA